MNIPNFIFHKVWSKTRLFETPPLSFISIDKTTYYKDSRMFDLKIGISIAQYTFTYIAPFEVKEYLAWNKNFTPSFHFQIEEIPWVEGVEVWKKNSFLGSVPISFMGENISNRKEHLSSKKIIDIALALIKYADHILIQFSPEDWAVITSLACTLPLDCEGQKTKDK